MYGCGMIPAATLETLRRKYTLLFPELNERSRRLWAASEAEALGRGVLQRLPKPRALAKTPSAEVFRTFTSRHVPQVGCVAVVVGENR